MSSQTDGVPSSPAVRAYLDPIRTVFLLDDQYPTFCEELWDSADLPRARALWQACVQKGWLCDVANRVELDSELWRRRIETADLLLLDFELQDGAPTECLRLLRHLAQGPTPNLVILYTHRSDLDRVRRTITATLLDPVSPPVPSEIEDILDEVRSTYEMSKEDIDWFLEGKRGTTREIRDTLRASGIEHGDITACAREIIVGHLRQHYIPKDLQRSDANGSTDTVRPSASGQEPRWVHQGNLFVAITGKSPTETDMHAEVARVLEILGDAIAAWSPPMLQVCLAHARHLIREDGYKADALALPKPIRQAGWLYLALSSLTEQETTQEQGEGAPSLEELASILLQQAVVRPTPKLASFMTLALSEATAPRTRDGAMKRAKKAAGFGGGDQDVLLDLNAYLSTEKFTGEHLTTGVVFTEAGDEIPSCVWVCASPACDLVPRDVQDWDVWRSSIRPYIPMVAIRAKRTRSKNGNDFAHRGRFLFLDRVSPRDSEPQQGGVFDLQQGDCPPALEQFMLIDSGLVTDGSFAAVSVGHAGTAEKPGPLKLTEHRFRILTQLRAPYAERILQMAGQHLSRIGLDFAPRLGGDTVEG